MTRVVLLGIDGCPPEMVSPDTMPCLAGLRDGLSVRGEAPLPSSTYPCFGALLTGCLPAHHGVRTTARRPGAVPGWAGEERVAVPTLFDACRAAGLRSAAIQGDHLLLSVLRAGRATFMWPPDGQPPADRPLDAHGYTTNEALRPHLLRAAADPEVDFVFGQINEGDTLGHDLGPDAAATLASYAGADRLIGEVLDLLRPRWSETVVIVVSDHGMERRTDRPPIDVLSSARARQIVVDALGDGGAALLSVRPRIDPRDVGHALAEVPGLEGWSAVGNALVVAAAAPGWIFSAPRLPANGFHGGPATARTIAAVTGGHPAVPMIARGLAARRPHLTDWAPTIAGILGLELPATDGRSLLEPSRQA